MTAMAELCPETRTQIANAHHVAPNRIFSDWKGLLVAVDTHDPAHRRNEPRYVGGMVMTVRDHLHAEVVVLFAQRGYHILCEKPMVTPPEDCIPMVDEVEKLGVMFGMP